MKIKDPIDFTKVESLRRHMLMTVQDISRFFGVSRETYYSWQKGKYPRASREVVLRQRIRKLFYALGTLGWPTPEAISANPKDRYAIFIRTLQDGGEE